MSDNRDSLPSWTAGVRIARAWSGIHTGQASFEDLAVAVEDASNRRDWAGREDRLADWVTGGFDIQPDR